MNRRGFFQSLAAIGAAAAAPAIFLPKFEPVRWKVVNPSVMINPEWVKAPYEVFFVDTPARFDESILKHDEVIQILERGSLPQAFPYPLRYTTIHGYLEPVHPFLKA